ncbi:LysM peptidoglycan-binding domain-containing protein [Streptomyces sp. GS7]|uniref:LysM peptidoglycan-binding domain-containing protein n=1 Tax=Streptomyces sp. GS7 TaxID=2692234 RepID=UPI001F1FE14A|nr:LysM peptidoglycan-binding domain-containing protein [Streptomyces sp. GS7]
MSTSGISPRRPARPTARRARRRPRPWQLASAAVALGAVCIPTAPLGAMTTPLHGTVTGAGKPLRGVRVTLFAGSHTGVRALGQATTDGSGSFTLSTSRPATGVLYVEAGDGRRLRLRSVVGVGDGGGVRARSVNTVTVNEVTTVATTYALAQFSDRRGIAGPGPGLQNAAATSFDLADPATGRPGGAVTSDSANSETLATLNTLADMISLCATGTPACAELLRLATPRGGAAPADTVQAVLNLVHHPTSSPSALHALARQARVFAPGLGAPPSAWVLALRRTASELYAPGRIGFDAKGNVWASNNWLPGTRQSSPFVTVLEPAGRPTLGSPIRGGGMDGGAWGLAVDHNGSVWVPSYGGNAMAKYSADGTPLSPSTGWRNGGLVHPQGVAVDQRGNLWIANSYGLKGAAGLGGVVVYPHGDPAKAFTITDPAFNHPFALQIDGRGRAWVTNSQISFAQLMETRQTGAPGSVGGSVTVLGPDFKPIRTIRNDALQGPVGLALDSRGNAWVAGLLSSAITEIRPDGTVAGVYRLPRRVLPWSVAVDGQDRVWVAGFGNSSVSLLCGANTAACPPGAATGTVLSPPMGLRNKAIQHLTAVQIDASGNVWLANNWSKLLPPTGGEGLVQLVGLATPVCTPLTPLPVRPPSAGCSPGTAMAGPPIGSADRYTVRPGDTLTRIGHAHGQHWRTLYRSNRSVLGPDPHRLRPGQRLTLP